MAEILATISLLLICIVVPDMIIECHKDRKHRKEMEKTKVRSHHD